MLFSIWLALCLVVVTFIALLLTIWRRAILDRYSGGRPVACPENKQPAVVNIDAQWAADAEMDGRSDLRLCDCSRWPGRSECDQACLQQAIQAEPYKPGVRQRAKQVYHLPVFLAGFAAYFLGAFWHAQYFSRARWIAAVGLTHAQVKQIGWSVWPHLLTFAVWLLFAYGVACLLAVCHRKGVLHGVLMAVALCAALAAASWSGIARMPHELLAIEASYALVATLVVGAIVGGLFDRMVLRTK